MHPIGFPPHSAFRAVSRLSEMKTTIFGTDKQDHTVSVGEFPKNAHSTSEPAAPVVGGLMILEAHHYQISSAAATGSTDLWFSMSAMRSCTSRLSSIICSAPFEDAHHQSRPWAGEVHSTGAYVSVSGRPCIVDRSTTPCWLENLQMI